MDFRNDKGIEKVLIIFVRFIIEQSRPICSPDSKNTDILPMSSRKRMIINKTRLAYHRSLASQDTPVCKSKNNSFTKKFYTNTKRTNSTSIQI